MDFASKYMASKGWTSGDGLGKNLHGRKDPVKVSSNSSMADEVFVSDWSQIKFEYLYIHFNKDIQVDPQVLWY